MALCGLVEDTKFRVLVFGRSLLSSENQTNHVSVECPLDIISGTDSVQFHDGFWENDLILGCYLGHIPYT